MFAVIRGQVSSDGSVATAGGERAVVNWREVSEVMLQSWWSELIWSSVPIQAGDRRNVNFCVGGIPVDVAGLQCIPRCIHAEVMHHFVFDSARANATLVRMPLLELLHRLDL
jgi:hypothetical protein